MVRSRGGNGVSSRSLSAEELVGRRKERKLRLELAKMEKDKEQTFALAKLKKEQVIEQEKLAMVEKSATYKPEMCDILKREIEHLEYLLSERGLSMDPLRILAILDWPVPLPSRKLRDT
ncbi:hypothetical protein NDU88_009386 [Pleurodeles waltl]|uniref:Uncharacterized protein n=1 Tax=Pleurodeles waltl TaxID=8319 RepID=A0AAV7PX39_PLEWA|nr:hypothetical protein NDU88_009386 [Pleurodeles waltl]